MIGQYQAYMLVARNSIQGSFWLLGNHFSLVTVDFYRNLGENITFYHQNYDGRLYQVPIISCHYKDYVLAGRDGTQDHVLGAKKPFFPYSIFIFVISLCD